MTKTKDKKLRKFINNQHLTHFNSFNSRSSVTEAFKASVTHNVREVAENITTPTLLIVGDSDDITSLPKQQELARMIKGSKIEVIEKVGHLTHYEKPNEVANAIKRFTL
jgi:pimeloyl-ACP methyl ester carboxylesterase